MKVVTDPNILAQLNAMSAQKQPVTDPNIIAQLNAQVAAPAPAAPAPAQPELGVNAGIATGLARTGAGIQQRLVEGLPGIENILPAPIAPFAPAIKAAVPAGVSSLYSSILSAVRPDLAPELSNIQPNDVRMAAGNVDTKLDKISEGQGMAFDVGNIVAQSAPYLAAPGGIVTAGALSGGASGYLEPNQAATPAIGAREALTNALYGSAGGAITGKVIEGATPSVVQIAKGTVNTGRTVLNKALGVNKEAVSEFADAGIDPILAQVGGRGSKIANSTLKNVPFASGVIEKSAQETIDRLSSKVDDVAGKYGPYRTNQETGKIVQKGVDNFIDRFKGKSDEMFSATRNSFAKAEPTSIANTSKFLGELGEGLTPELKKALSNPKMQSITKAIEKDMTPEGTLPYETLLATRSKIGRELSDSVMSDVPRAELKQFYGALSEDLKAAAAAKGPRALSEFNRANTYYKAGMDRIESSLAGLVKKGVDPEKVYNLAVSGSKDGATRLAKIKKSLTADEFSAIQGQTVREMGRAKPGAQDASGEVFSAETFLTNWNKMSPEAKSIMFKSDVSESLNRLAKVAFRYKEVSKLNNHSNTANNVGLMAVGGAGFANLPATIAGLSAAYGGAKLMTSPRFVNWLSESASKNSPSAFSDHVRKLGVIAMNSDPEAREGIKTFLQGLTSGVTQNGFANRQPSDAGTQ